MINIAKLAAQYVCRNQNSKHKFKEKIGMRLHGMWLMFAGLGVLLSSSICDAAAVSNTVLVCNNSEIVRYTVENGTWTSNDFAQVNNIGGIASNGRRVFVGEYVYNTPCRILEYDMDGNYQRSLVTAPSHVEHMTMSRYGNWLYASVGLWLADDAAIHRYDPVTGIGGVFIPNQGTNAVGEVLWKFKIPRGLVEDDDGNLWVSDRDTGSVYIFGNDGTYLDKVTSLPGIQTLYYSNMDQKIYGVTTGDDTYVIDPATGVATTITITGLGGRQGLTQIDGTLYGSPDGYITSYDLDSLTSSNVIASVSGVKQVIGFIQADSEGLSDCRISSVGGVPTITVNGEAIGPCTYTGPNDSEQWARLAEAGFKVFYIKMTLGDSDLQGFEYKRVDNTVRKLLQVVPDALVIFRIYLPPTASFGAAYPDECMAWEGGDHAPYAEDFSLDGVTLDRQFGKYSFASDVWRDQAAESLESFAEYASSSDWRQYVGGYFLAGGFPGEWNNWRRPEYMIDFSPAMTRAFRGWLSYHYDGDVSLLRSAWNDPTVSFETAQVPSRIERDVKEFGDFYSPASNQRTLDYLRCHNDVTMDNLRQFSKVLKKTTGGSSLVGCFYGYLQNVDYKISGNTSFKELLRCPTIDFWTTPPPYENRGVGDETTYRFPIQSMMSHNKLWISEDDIRTHSSGPVHFRYGGTDTVEEACEGLKRSFSKVLASGVSSYWFEMNPGWYVDPKIIELFTSMQQIGDATKATNKRSCADIAVVVDQESLKNPSQSVSFNLLDRFRIHELSRIGAPYDYWEMDDLLAASDEDLGRYKLIIFLNAFSLNDSERGLIDSRLKSNGRHLLWLYASGLVRSPVDASLANMKSLTGFDLEFLPDQRSQVVNTTGAGNIPGNVLLGVYNRPITTGEAVDAIRTPVPIDPPWVYGAFSVSDQTATELGQFTEGGGVGETGFALKQMGNWTSIYASSLVIPSNVLRALAQNAGCHIYDGDDDVVYANHHVLGIHTMDAGNRHIILREESDVYDLFEQQIVAENVTSFDVNIPEKSTRLYYLGDVSNIEALLTQASIDAVARQETNVLLQAERIEEFGGTEPALLWTPGPYELDEGGAVYDFLLSADYPNPVDPQDEGLNTDYLNGEANFRPKNGSDGFVAWRSPVPIVHVTAEEFSLSADQQICYYVCFYLELPLAQEISINIGSDDGYRLWFGGEELGSLSTTRGVAFDSNKHVTNATAGRHCVMLKIQQDIGDTGFCIRILGADNQPLEGAKLWLKPDIATALVCNNSEIVRYTVENGTWTSNDFAQVNNIGGIASNGRRVFVGEYVYNTPCRILEYDMDGNYQRSLVTAPSHVEHMTMSRDGNWLYASVGLWLADDAAIHRYDPVTGIGGVFIPNQGTNAVGEVLWKFKIPRGLVEDDDGNLWVSDRDTGSVYKFSSAGTYLDKVTSLTGIQTLYFSSVDQKIYGTTNGDDTYVIDPATGVATTITITGLGGRQGLTQIDGTLYGAPDGYITSYDLDSLTSSNVIASVSGVKQIIRLSNDLPGTLIIIK